MECAAGDLCSNRYRALKDEKVEETDTIIETTKRGAEQMMKAGASG